MSRHKKEPLRSLTTQEQTLLRQISRSQSAPAVQVTRAKLLLAVSQGQEYLTAARSVGRRSGDAVSSLVARFNQEGLAALEPRHGGGARVRYDQAAQERILKEYARPPDREQDGTATWSLSTLQRALRGAPDGLPQVSTFTLWQVLREAQQSPQRVRTWCETGTVQRRRKDGVVTVTDPDTEAKKKLIEDAYLLGKQLGLSTWCCDQAGPFPTVPYTGTRWQPEGLPACQPHEYIRNGSVKILTLFHPADGQVRVEGTTSCTNPVLHGWLKRELSAIRASLPSSTLSAPTDPTALHAAWQRWQEGLSVKPTLPVDLPPLRMLLVLDNLAGHKTPEFVLWLFAHGVMPLYTPLGGSWLNMAESIQRILKRRALEGQHPTTTEQIVAWFEASARGWNQAPTAFEWGGKRAARRQRARERRHALGGSGACTRVPIRYWKVAA